LLVRRITIQPTSLHIEIHRIGLTRLISNVGGPPIRAEGAFNLITPIQLKRRGVEAKLVMRSAAEQSALPDPKLVAVLADAHLWLDDLAQGRATSLRHLAKQYDRDIGEISCTLPIAFLAPEIVESILKGGQPVDLTPRCLKRMRAMPDVWDQQRDLLNPLRL
jgi:hypothetical protein